MTGTDHSSRPTGSPASSPSTTRSESVATGLVISTSPAALSEVPRGSTVRIVVSNGPSGPGSPTATVVAPTVTTPQPRNDGIGAMMLGLDEFARVLVTLPTPLLMPLDGERYGYVPTVVYSCGAPLHGGTDPGGQLNLDQFPEGIGQDLSQVRRQRRIRGGQRRRARVQGRIRCGHRASSFPVAWTFLRIARWIPPTR